MLYVLYHQGHVARCEQVRCVASAGYLAQSMLPLCSVFGHHAKWEATKAHSSSLTSVGHALRFVP